MNEKVESLLAFFDWIYLQQHPGLYDTRVLLMTAKNKILTKSNKPKREEDTGINWGVD